MVRHHVHKLRRVGTSSVRSYDLVCVVVPNAVDHELDLLYGGVTFSSDFMNHDIANYKTNPNPQPDQGTEHKLYKPTLVRI